VAVIAMITTMSDMARAFQDQDHCWHLVAAMVWRKADLPHLRLLSPHRTTGAPLQAVGHKMHWTKI